MQQHAGSALSGKKKFGHLQQWKEWYPYKEPTRWLLLSGAVVLPNVLLSSLEEGFEVLMNTLLKLKFNIDDFAFDCGMSKGAAVSAIKAVFDSCLKAKPQAKPVIYYAGHGCIGTGDWIFSDGLLTIREMISLVPKGSFYPFILADCSYSGHWADYCLKRIDIHGILVVAAVPYHTENVFTSRGGRLVQLLTLNESSKESGNQSNSSIKHNSRCVDAVLTSSRAIKAQMYRPFVSSQAPKITNTLSIKNFSLDQTAKGNTLSTLISTGTVRRSCLMKTNLNTTTTTTTGLKRSSSKNSIGPPPIYGDLWTSDEIALYPRKCTNFQHLIRSHLEQENYCNCLVALTINNGKLSALFGRVESCEDLERSNKGRVMHIAHTWSATFKACEEAINHHRGIGFSVVSMVNDGSTYHVYYERQKRYPNIKQIFKQAGCLNEICDWVEKNKSFGFVLTHCCSRGRVGWFLIMANNEGHTQRNLTRKMGKTEDFLLSLHTSWEECSIVAAKQENQGFIKMCITYNEERNQYLLITHKHHSHKKIVCHWNVFAGNDLCWARNWLKIKYSECLQPFFLFKIPDNNKGVDAGKLLVGVTNMVDRITSFDLAMDFTKY